MTGMPNKTPEIVQVGGRNAKRSFEESVPKLELGNEETIKQTGPDV
jgi:hypothetical protein